MSLATTGTKKHDSRLTALTSMTLSERLAGRSTICCPHALPPPCFYRTRPPSQKRRPIRQPELIEERIAVADLAG